MADIKLQNIKKVYDNGHVAVKAVDLDVSDGEFLVLVGPSGCGKSTTLRMIAGLESASDGDIMIGGQRVNDLEPGDRDIAMVFQNYALYPHMTVRQNLSFGLRMRKTPKAEIAERVNQAAQVLSIESLLDRKPKQLSGGQRQRVAVGRAIVRQPKAFLFDEPLSNLDAKLRVQMRTELARLHQRLKTTTVYVTHDQVEAMTLGDRIVVMRDGVIQQVGKPLEIYQKPANQFVAGFIGSPAMNFISGSIRNGVFFSAAGEYQLGERNVSDQHAILGFRPEDLTSDDSHPLLATVNVDVVERMGYETIVYFGMDNNSMIARIKGNHSYSVGQTVNLHLPATSWHLFSSEDDHPRI